MSAVELHHELVGPPGAPVIVFAGSLGTTGTMWDPQVRTLEGAYRVLRFDHRGHGRSPVPPGPYALEDLGADVVALLDRLDLDKVGFCGLSMGGFVGLWLAVHRADRLRWLLLASTSATPGSPEFWHDRATRVRAEGMGWLAEGVASRWFAPDFATAHPEIVEPIVTEFGALAPEGYAGACEAIAEVDLRGDLAKVALPVVVVTGSDDVAIAPAHGEALVAGISGAERVVIEGAGHLLNLEHPATFTASLRQLAERRPQDEADS